MGSPSDSTPNFDFLNPQSAEPKPPADSEVSEEESVSAAQEDEVTVEIPASVVADKEEEASDDEQSVFSDVGDIPDPEENVSDGSTLVIHNRDQAEKFEPPAETFETEQPTQPLTPPTSDETAEAAEVEAEREKISEEEEEEEIPSDESKEQASTPPPAASDSTPNFGFLSGVEESAFPTPKKAKGPAINFDPNAPVTKPVEPAASEPTPVSEANSEDVQKSAEETTASEVAEPATSEPEAETSPEPQPEPVAEVSTKPATLDRSATTVAATAATTATFMGMNQRTALIVLATYASLVTLLFAMWVMGQKSHQLESLPDVIPETEGQLTHIPPQQPLPKFHTLHVGDSERYGNLQIEVIKITKEPIQFVHYAGDTSRSKEPSPPVWKLWLKFTNVSDEQTFAPLDRDLTLRWIVKAEEQREYSNYYISQRNVSDSKAPTIQMYRLPKASDWDMQAQNLGQPLKPGESVETYIATSDEQPLDLEGELVWRFQFRKGFSPSGNGVTTMVEVAFKPDEIATAA